MDEIPQNTRELLNSANWDRLWRQCLLYAAYEERRYPGLSRRCRDVAQTAIEKTFSGERTWNPEVCDLSHHLRMTIRSLYSNAYGRMMSRQKYERLNVAEASHAPAPATAQEDLDYLRKAVRLLRQHDPALAEFFIAASHHLTTGCATEKEAARAMKIAPSTFTKTKARISKIINSWCDKDEREMQK